MYIRRTITPFYTSSSRKHQHLQSNSVKLQKFTENTTALIWWDLLTGGPSVIKTTRSITQKQCLHPLGRTQPHQHMYYGVFPCPEPTANLQSCFTTTLRCACPGSAIAHCTGSYMTWEKSLFRVTLLFQLIEHYHWSKCLTIKALQRKKFNHFSHFLIKHDTFYWSIAHKIYL